MLVGAVFAACGFLWFVPEYWGSGDWLRAGHRAHQPNPDSRRVRRLPVPRGVQALGADPLAAGAARRADRARAPDPARGEWDLRCWLALAATVLMIVVALMTQAGFAGNLRYVALPAALVCVLAGVGWVGA